MVVVVAVVRSHQMSRKLYRKRASVEDCSLQGSLETHVRLCQW